MLSAQAMRFVFAILAMCLLLLSVTNGTAANAAFSPEPSPAELALEHQKGDGDEVPDCPINGGSHHHHASCGGHQLGTQDTAIPLLSPLEIRPLIAASTDRLPPGLNPASEPHPPKA